MEDLLTLKDIAQSIGVPESNLRYYKNRIGDFLPSIGKGRRRRYFPETIEIFKQTIEYLHNGVTLDRVHSILSESRPLAVKDDGSPPTQEELAELIVAKLRESLAAAAEEARWESDSGGPSQPDASNVEISALQERVSALETEKASLENELYSVRLENTELSETIAGLEASAESAASADCLGEEGEGAESELAAKLKYANGEIIQLRNQLRDAEDRLERMSEFEQKCLELLPELARVNADRDAVAAKLLEKERIIEGQKDALDKARSKRLAIQEELGRLRASLPPDA